jgi:hypothetical protein
VAKLQLSGRKTSVTIREQKFFLDSISGHVGFSVDEVTLGQIFSESVVSPSNAPFLYPGMVKWAHLWAKYQGIQSHPSIKIKIKEEDLLLE